MVVAAATTGILSLYGTPAFADSHANGSAQDSPGAGSGNNLQLPVNVPVNACGNTVDVIAREKAGIIKAGATAILAAQPASAAAELLRRAVDVEASVARE